MSDVLDLDALVPKAGTIKFGDQIIEVPPPKTGDVLILGVLSQELVEAARTEEGDAVDAAVDKITKHIHKIIPQLEGKDLSMAQINGLVDLINTMTTPPQSENSRVSPAGPKVQ